MIHPKIEVIFPDENKSKIFFSLISKKIKKIDEFLEFINWHSKVIKEVILEIENTKKIDFSNKESTKQWSNDFLTNYDEKIRHMRNISNLVFDRFHKLKEEEFDEIILEEKSLAQEIKDMMEVFLNKKELLIGKLIFAYRENWFVANQISNPDFKLGSIQDYKIWVDDNYENLKKLDKSLEIIYQEISKWKG